LAEPDPGPGTAASAPTRAPAPEWPRRVAIGLGIAVSIFIVLDGLFWFLLRAVGLLPTTFPITGWNSTTYAIWIVVAALAGAGYALAPLRLDSPAGWAWRATGGVLLALVLYLLIDTQTWYYLNRILPSSTPVSNWPTPLYEFWLVLAVLLGMRFVLAPSPRFGTPWWTWRILGGIALGLSTYFAVVWLPLYLVSMSQSNGIPLASFPSSLVVVGSLFALLAGAAYAAHPTRYYGPIEIGAGGLEIFYFVIVVGTAPYSVEYRSIALSVGTLAILLGLVVVILISMAGDVVTTIEDFARPGERRAWQYPTPTEPASPRR
jgi:hypothetical protein